LNTAYDLILFDIDGTLVITKGAGRESTRRAMLELVGDDCGALDHPFGGKTDWQILTELLAKQGIPAEVASQRVPTYAGAMERHLSAIIAAYPVVICAGARETVDWLRARGQPMIGVLTGNVQPTAPLKLRAGGFDPAWFAVGAYGSEAHSRDDLPPLAMARAEALLGHQLDPRRVMVIGDTPADVQCAKANGCVSVAVLTGFSNRAELSACKPDYLLDDLHGVRALIEG
jgi:phosphoglycolate phosphatase-like HAD superfamily hydrolase